HKESSDACFNAGDYKWITICIGFELSNIADMRGLLCLDYARETGAGGWLNRTSSEKPFKRCRGIDARRFAKRPILISEQITDAGFANPQGVLQHCREHRLELARRAGDHFQHLRARGLLRQGFAKLVEQARVLYGDNCL